VDRRIEAGFRRRLDAVLRPLDPCARQLEVERLLSEARSRAARDGLPTTLALLETYERARDGARATAAPSGLAVTLGVPRFLCDLSLGGLARWLRAAGYEAAVAPEVPGHRLPDEALRRGLVLLTTDAEALERRIVADGSLLVVWLPSSLTVHEKLGLVLRELRLGLREPRCMTCGGALLSRAKHVVAARIPPRTARWKDEYFVCGRCDQLFWRGTHWQRIVPLLRSAAVPS
jgi:uncharacterized protein with PIN domain